MTSSLSFTKLLKMNVISIHFYKKNLKNPYSTVRKFSQHEYLSLFIITITFIMFILLHKKVPFRPECTDH